MGARLLRLLEFWSAGGEPQSAQTPRTWWTRKSKNAPLFSEVTPDLIRIREDKETLADQNSRKERYIITIVLAVLVPRMRGWMHSAMDAFLQYPTGCKWRRMVFGGGDWACKRPENSKIERAWKTIWPVHKPLSSPCPAQSPPGALPSAHAAQRHCPPFANPCTVTRCFFRSLPDQEQASTRHPP